MELCVAFVGGSFVKTLRELLIPKDHKCPICARVELNDRAWVLSEERWNEMREQGKVDLDGARLIAMCNSCNRLMKGRSIADIRYLLLPSPPVCPKCKKFKPQRGQWSFVEGKDPQCRTCEKPLKQKCPRCGKPSKIWEGELCYRCARSDFEIPKGQVCPDCFKRKTARAAWHFEAGRSPICKKCAGLNIVITPEEQAILDQVEAAEKFLLGDGHQETTTDVEWED
jgi:hypothetical protein